MSLLRRSLQWEQRRPGRDYYIGFSMRFDPSETGRPPFRYNPEAWQRACDESLRRSRERRGKLTEERDGQ